MVFCWFISPILLHNAVQKFGTFFSGHPVYPREMVMRETLDGFQGGLQIGERMIMNLRYADDIILLATSEAELQELVDRLDRVSRKYSLLINVDKTKVMASDGIACRSLIQNENRTI